MSNTDKFNSTLKRLDDDLRELESISNHLQEVKSFSNEIKELGTKFNKHLTESSKLVKESTLNLNDFTSKNSDKINNLTQSHQKLADRIKDMEDKVTVLNTKTESMAKDIGNTIKQSHKGLSTLLTSIEKQNSEYHKIKMNELQGNRKLILYLIIPILLMLIFLVIDVFVNIY